MPEIGCGTRTTTWLLFDAKVAVMYLIFIIYMISTVTISFDTTTITITLTITMSTSASRNTGSDVASWKTGLLLANAEI